MKIFFKSYSYRELEELEAIKEAEEAALAEAEAAANEAADAAAGLLDFDFEDDGDEEDKQVGANKSLQPSPEKDQFTSTIKYQGNNDLTDRSEDSETKTSQTTDSSDTLSLDKSDQSLHGPQNGFIRRQSIDDSSNLHQSEKYNSNTIRKPLVIFNYNDAEKPLPYADDSKEMTPKHHNGGVIIDAPLKLNRKFSYANYTMDSLNNQFDGNGKPNHFISNGGRESLGVKVNS